MITIKDIARAANVTPMTVSNVIHAKSRMALIRKPSSLCEARTFAGHRMLQKLIV
ncbi:hypothetical protein CAFE_24200 [Caprobacter fermentans]|uniref:LacI family DNA-binding transcriptional regulator n=1 Tax=Caproicibacter fermentans TaxID=2576756 RepID=A0A6N8I1T3_9FIRM|nr:hypothetical protein [Caproicibacter fermentans]QNK39728.1 LacI family DNA-binding transcriptional regulator [Caproicibacter fermentans]